MDSISNPSESKYTESKLVWLSPTVETPWRFNAGVGICEGINANIDKFLKDGWTPVSISQNINGNGVLILFCR